MNARPEKTMAPSSDGKRARRLRLVSKRVGDQTFMVPDLQDEATREEIMRQIRAAAAAEDDFRDELEAWLALAGETLADE